jgi:hypothetical protein
MQGSSYVQGEIMANTVNFVGYSRGSGRNPFFRVFSVSFSGTYAQDNAEVINLNTANNPGGIEDAQVPLSSPPPIDPFVLGSTVGGLKAELQIGGNGTPGEFGIRFYGASATAGEATELAAGTDYSAVFPANGSSFGEVLIGIFQSF